LADHKQMTKMWFGKSARDLRTAKLLLAQNSEDFWEPIVFHGQQCAEKAIKGFLTFHKIRFDKTHDMETLINLVAKVSVLVSEDLEEAKTLTKYAVAYRYPEENDPPEPLTEKTCVKITTLAESVFNKIVQQVPLA
jgi:HEPN domain-containing protein